VCTVGDLASEGFPLRTSSFQVKLEKINAGADVQHESEKSFSISGKKNRPSSYVYGTQSHATSVNDMATLVDVGIVVLEGGLTHVHGDENV
jgi:hypothetical protein